MAHEAARQGSRGDVPHQRSGERQDLDDRPAPVHEFPAVRKNGGTPGHDPAIQPLPRRDGASRGLRERRGAGRGAGLGQRTREAVLDRPHRRLGEGATQFATRVLDSAAHRAPGGTRLAHAGL